MGHGDRTFNKTKLKFQLLRDQAKTAQLSHFRYEPVGTVATLQALFSMMEFTNRRAVDPAPLIAKLALDPLVQQDAQEFSKLFMSLLENSLSEQTTESVRTVVQTQFRE